MNFCFKYNVMLQRLSISIFQIHQGLKTSLEYCGRCLLVGSPALKPQTPIGTDLESSQDPLHLCQLQVVIAWRMEGGISSHHLYMGIPILDMYGIATGYLCHKCLIGTGHIPAME